MMDRDEKKAHALRRYLSARARGRPYPEKVRLVILPGDTDDGGKIGAWIEPSSAPADARSRQLRHPGMPWCPYLGRDMSIASDHQLQAYFATIEDDQDEWSILLRQCQKNRHKALRALQHRGYEILKRLHFQRAQAAQAAQGVRPKPAVGALAALYASQKEGR